MSKQEPPPPKPSKKFHFRNGRLRSTQLSQNEAPSATPTALYICPHTVVMRDLCAECGKDLRKLETGGAAPQVSMVHSVPELRVSQEHAQKLALIDEDRLLQQKKLVLLVDLDQTLIHTTNDNVPEDMKDVWHFQLQGHGSVWYHTRVRLHTLSFLSSISQLYELHIATFGTRAYAHTIARLLDPSGVLFGDRILSRDECFSQNCKTANLKELFPRGDHMVCIIDDREDVWNHAPNLVHVKPYHFFQHTGDINAPEGLGKREEDGVGLEDQKEDQDDYLLYLEQILKSIHEAFYALYLDDPGVVPSVKNVIPYVRRKVLKSTSIVFSGVVPTEVPLHSRSKTKPYTVAASLGAQISEQISLVEPVTTHLVAARTGTAKVNEAQRWEKVDERLFGVKGSGVKKPALRKERTPSGRFMDTINPLLSFSLDEIDAMGHEVEDGINESSSSSDVDSSDSESRGEKRKSRTETETEDELGVKFRRGEVPSDMENLEEDEEDEEEEWMAQALERQFMEEED